MELWNGRIYFSWQDNSIIFLGISILALFLSKIKQNLAI